MNLLSETLGGRVVLSLIEAIVIAVLICGAIYLIWGVYTVIVFVRQLANEPRIIPVLATLNYVLNTIIGAVIFVGIAALSFAVMPILADGDIHSVVEFLELCEDYLVNLFANDVGIVIAMGFAAFMTIVEFVSPVLSLICGFDLLYTIFCPGKVRDKYNGEIGDVLVRHRRWSFILGIVIAIAAAVGGVAFTLLAS